MEYRFTAMNTTFLLAGLEEGPAVETEAWFRQVEETCSRFRPQSEVARLNALREGCPSPLLTEILQESMTLQRETAGIFTPFLGERLTFLGYDRSLEQLSLERERTGAEIGEGEQEPGWNQPRGLETPFWENGRLSLPRGLGIDLGGFAKGWAAQRAADRLMVAGAPGGLIDAGGDITLWGRDPQGDCWGVGIAHPLQPDKELAALWLRRPAGIATSSVVKRRWRQGEKIYHHILDPRTGQPAQSPFLQVTVLAPDLAVAEVYAKVLLILGTEEGIALLRENRPQLAFIGVDQAGNRTMSENMRVYCDAWEVEEG